MPAPELNKKNAKAQVDYSTIANSSKFKNLLAEKKRFILPMTIFFFVFYFSLPLMTSYSNVLNKPAIGDISWAWVFAFAQFIMTWSLCILYSKRAAKFDGMVNEISSESETSTVKGGKKR